MNFLLDTNAISELMKPRPNPGLMAWIDGTDEDRIFLSVVSLAELRYGVERMSAGKSRRRLELWLLELPLRFERRILPVDSVVADAWGRTVSRNEAAGRPIEAMDALLAATAEMHNMTLVTRNVSDFSLLKAVLNPWT